MSSEEVDAHLKSGDILGALTTLTALAVDIRREMRRKFMRNLLIMCAVLAVAVGGIVVGARSWQAAGTANKAASEAKRATALIVAQRSDSRLVVCLNSNEEQLGARRAHMSESHDLVAAIVGPDPTIDVVMKAAVFNTEHDRLIVKNYPLRDCSPKGIRAFYQSPVPSTKAGS